LYAISNHFGGLSGGHYTAYGKNCIDGQWYDFNDSSVTSMSPDSLVSRSAYLLFYRRREDSDKVNSNSSEMLTKEETDVTLDPNNEDQIYELD
jgi:ubiquitin carboxyl-terminal hydrolase 4/11/15